MWRVIHSLGNTYSDIWVMFLQGTVSECINYTLGEVPNLGMREQHKQIPSLLLYFLLLVEVVVALCMYRGAFCFILFCFAVV